MIFAVMGTTFWSSLNSYERYLEVVTRIIYTEIVEEYIGWEKKNLH